MLPATQTAGGVAMAGADEANSGDRTTDCHKPVIGGIVINQVKWVLARAPAARCSL